MEDKDLIKQRPIKDILVGHRNTFQKTMVDNILDLQRHIVIQKENKNYQRQDQQTGKFIDIETMISDYRKAYNNAKSYIEIIDTVLATGDEEKMLAKIEEFANTFPSPVDVEGEKEEGKEGE